MINQQRVRRIKNLIYAFLILVFFLPAVLAVALLFRVLSLENTLNDALAGESSSLSASGQSAGGDLSLQPGAATGEEQLVIPGGGVEYNPADTDLLMPPVSPQPNGEEAAQPDPDSGGSGEAPGDSAVDASEADVPGAGMQGDGAAPPVADADSNVSNVNTPSGGETPHWNADDNPGYSDSPNTGVD